MESEGWAGIITLMLSAARHLRLPSECLGCWCPTRLHGVHLGEQGTGWRLSALPHGKPSIVREYDGLQFARSWIRAGQL
jgi:hypothetical protein